MKRLIALTALLWSLQACGSEPAPTTPTAVIPECSDAQLLGYAPKDEELQAHRQFAMPVISYPFGTERQFDWGLSLKVRVDEAGAVVCYKPVKAFFAQELPILNDERRAQIAKLSSWRYKPFVQDGRPVAAVLSEHVAEQESPEKHLPLPEVPLDKVRIVLNRSGCFGTCPSYQVEIRGDGSVVYTGEFFVDVKGEHRYRIPMKDVAALVESLRAKDLWSMRPVYRAGITDNPTYQLTLDMGGQVHQIEDYVGTAAGMPLVVSQFEEEVDKVSRSSQWTRLSKEAVDRLEAEGFAFRSDAGRDLLFRAVANRDSQNNGESMARMLELGTPTDEPPAKKMPSFADVSGSLIDNALERRRSLLIAPLIAKGALETNGKPDQAKVDSAFRAAIKGGRLSLVQQIWQASERASHPALTFVDESDDEEKVRKVAPVTLLLEYRGHENYRWEGLEIAQWLVAQGCDLKAARANGDTLLHIAAGAGDVAFVRYLLDQGFDPQTPGEFGMPALGGADNEDVAMLLLEAGSDPSKMDDRPGEFLAYAKERHWARVVAWLDARKKP